MTSPSIPLARAGIRATTVMAAATVLSAVVLIGTALNAHPDPTGLAAFALLAGIAELVSAGLFPTGRNSFISVTLAVVLGCAAAVGEQCAVLAAFAGGSLGILAAALQAVREGGSAARGIWRAGLRQPVGNAAALVLSSAAAGLVYRASGGVPGDPLHVSNLLPLVFAAAVLTLTDALLLASAARLHSTLPLASIWNQDYRWNIPAVFGGSAFFGGSLALAYYLAGGWGAALLFLPVITFGSAYRIYANRTHGFIDSLQQMNLDLTESNTQLLETLGGAIDACDAFTYGHSAQVAVYAGALARRMGLPQAEQDRIIKAALVHDIGKIGISDQIISKPGKLEQHEIEILRRHPTIGAEILGRMRGLQDLVDLVHYHHEWYDGTGYPDRMAGDALPVGARVLALADSLDAMLAHRPYRPSLTFDEVVKEVVRCSGTQFDPLVVRAFLELVEAHGPAFFTGDAARIEHNMLVAAVGVNPGEAARRIKRQSEWL